MTTRAPASAVEGPRKSESIHDTLAAIDQRLVQARRTAREAELSYQQGQRAIAEADRVHLDAQAAKEAEQPSDVEGAAKALTVAKEKAMPARQLEIAQRAVELVAQERVAFQASHAADFERQFDEQYAIARRKVEESQEAIVAADALWQETNRRHFSFRQAVGGTTGDIPQTPAPLRDSARIIERTRESV